MKLSFSILILFIFLLSYGQEWETRELPNSILKSFKKKYDGFPVVKWKKSRADEYIVYFTNKENKTEIARYDSVGNWIETISFIEREEAPEKIVMETERAYSDAISIEYQIIHKANGTKIYLIQVITDDAIHEIIYSQDAKFINITTYEN